MDYAALAKKLSTGLSSSPGQVGMNLGVGLLDSHFLQDGEYSKGEQMTSGALRMGSTGFQMGNAIMPGIGGAIGAGVGLVGGAIKGHIDHNKHQKELYDSAVDGMSSNHAAEKAYGRNVSSGYKSQGVYKHAMYANGGYASDDFLVEDGEVMIGESPEVNHSGIAKRLASGAYEFDGATHAAPSGGIGVQDTEGFVFSNRLKTDPKKFLSDL